MMSLPADIGPTFAIAKTQQPFRLLELPPELLDLLTSADPPKYILSYCPADLILSVFSHMPSQTTVQISRDKESFHSA